ncbi:lariat debranching enzyme, C-terminal domain-containing protein [Aspergillus crustosus]
MQGHGCLHNIYTSVERAAALKGWDGVDLLIIGGDFQAVRNSNDMACMSVPPRFKEIADFHEYYSGNRIAPYLTVFIGGNHEASNYLFELYYGGWVAPNIYYMGAANVLRCGPLRLAALSGIWKGYDYRKPHFERIPYNSDDLHSIYHVRELDVRKLLQIRTQVDIGLSHDWPKKVEDSGDSQRLFSVKHGFRNDSRDGKLGSSAARYVLDRLRPAYWFSAHLHVKFAASIQHSHQDNSTKHHFGLDGTSLTAMILGEEDEGSQPYRPALEISNSEVPTTVPQRDDEEQNVQTEALTQRDENRPSFPIAQELEVTGAAPIQSNAESTSDSLSAWNNFQHIAAKNEAEENSRFLSDQEKNPDGLGRKLVGVEKSGPRETKKQKVEHEALAVRNVDEIDLGLDSDSDQEPSTGKPSASNATAEPPTGTTIAAPQPEPHPPATATQSEVSEDLRNQLPSSFSAPPAQTQTHYRVAAVNNPFPEAIRNETTNFLALDKCLPNREFLQLLEVDAISDTECTQFQRPFRLQYDQEWLAITRVFADELHLGDLSARPSDDKGDAIYTPLIIEEEKWVEEHVVKAGKLAVPENFTQTAPVYDPEVPVTTEQQPPEYNNPQTAAFCELVGIENKFYLTDEQREARLAVGPRPSDSFGSNHRGRGGGRGGRGRGRGHGRSWGRGRR